MYKIDKEIKTKLTEKEIKKKLYNISSKKRRASIFFKLNQNIVFDYLFISSHKPV